VAELITFAPELLDMADYNGDTPLHVCCANNYIDCINLLLQTEADPDIPNCDGHTPASICQSVEALEVLFETGANLFCTDSKQRSLLFNAAAKGDLERIAFLLEIDVEQIMLDAPDARGDTPLHAACCNGRSEVVELLLSYAARPDNKNHANYTPLDLARLCKKPKCVEIMEEYLGFYNPVPDFNEHAGGHESRNWDLATAAGIAKSVQVCGCSWLFSGTSKVHKCDVCCRPPQTNGHGFLTKSQGTITG